jgi:hypothetical protein
MLLRLLSLVCLIFVSQLSLTQQSGSARTHVPRTCPVTQVSKPPFVRSFALWDVRLIAQPVWSPPKGFSFTRPWPRIIGRPSAAFRLVNSVGIATSRVFGVESSRPASLLCTLRTHQSPGEWQHSLSACVLALAVRDFHPLDSIKGFHRLIFGSSSSTLFPAR